MKIVTSIAKMRELSRQTRGSGLRVALVPTMGFLHEGHLELVRRARAEAELTVVSIFVNPTQFDRASDFDSYPRDDMADRAMLEEEGVDVLFAPEADQVYLPGAATSIGVEGLADGLCGSHRPGHFTGVATVVAALFNMVEPDLAVFGEKDYQQLQLVRRMARDLHFGVEIVSQPTVREADGLAMSSRNARLSAEDRRASPVIHRGLLAAAEAYAAGERDTVVLAAAASTVIQTEPAVRVEYLQIVDGDDLSSIAKADERSVLAVAAFVGDVRLIDNVVLARTASQRTSAPSGAQPTARYRGAHHA